MTKAWTRGLSPVRRGLIIDGKHLPLKTKKAWIRWRLKIQWTDEQLAGAAETLAADNFKGGLDGIGRYWQNVAGHFRGQRIQVTKKMISQLCPVLVTTCGLCGKKAWYRMGPEGRCREHMHDKTDGFKIRQKILDERSNAIVALETELDKKTLVSSNFRAWRAGNKQKDRNR